MTRRAARCALVLLALVGGTGAAWHLLRVFELLRDNPWTTVLLDLTPVQARIDAAIAAAVGGDVDALVLEALAADDPARAAALAEAAACHGRPLDPATLDALAASRTLIGRTAHQARDLGRALSGGPIRTGAGLATAIAFELSPAADVRDIAREGSRMFKGEPPDRLLLGLSVLGLGATAASVAQPATGGATLAGKAVLKAMLRAGRTTPALALDLRRALGGIGPEVLLRYAPRLAPEPAAARGLAGAADAARLSRAAEALGAIAVTRGPRTALLAAGAARSLDDLPALERIARELGSQADNAFRILGHSAAPALRLWRAAWWLAGEIAAGVLVILAAFAGLILAVPRRWLRRQLRRLAASPRPAALAG
jgi:cytochrome c553